MAVTCSTSPTSGSYLTPMTVTYAGLSNSTAYIVTETGPSGFKNYREITWTVRAARSTRSSPTRRRVT